MDAGQAIQRFCGAPTKAGGTCKRQAGWGTPYTTGPCRRHGGALPNVRKHHARVAALQFVEGQMGAEVDVDPLEAPLIALRIARGIVRAWQQRISGADGRSDEVMDEGLRAANMDLARISKIVADVGVADRQARLLERFADQLSLAFEEAIAATALSAVERQQATVRYATAIARLEAPVIDGTARDVAA